MIGRGHDRGRGVEAGLIVVVLVPYSADHPLPVDGLFLFLVDVRLAVTS